MAAPKRALLLAVLFSLTVAAPAHGALGTPAPASPANGASMDALPAFVWSQVAGADSYEFQLAADQGMNSPVLGRGEDQFVTKNTRATLKKTVPNGTYWWRVRALKSGSTPSAWSVPRSLTKSWTSAPALQAPAHGSVVPFPGTPLVLRWSPVPRAAKYLVQLGTDPSLGSLVSPSTETQATAFAPNTLLPAGTYYWNVTPVDAQGHRGAPSGVASFLWAWGTATTANVADLAAEPEVYDPFFSWDPVPGAAKYEVEINSSVDFAPGSKVCCSTPVVGGATSVSPTQVFKDNTYFWRVRALDGKGNAGQWNLGPAFTKTFDNVPPVSGTSIKNLRMRDNAADPGVDADPVAAGYQTRVPVLRWDPVPGASSYEVDVVPHTAGICDWSAPILDHWRAYTSTTAWTPLGTDWNFVKPYSDPMQVANDGGTKLDLSRSYCARVRARSNRDSTGQEVYGDYTYVNDGTGKAFEFVDYPLGPERECVGCHYLGATDYTLPAVGTLTARTPLLTWEPLPRRAKKTLLNTNGAQALTLTSRVDDLTGLAGLTVSTGDAGANDWLSVTKNGVTQTHTYPDGDLENLKAKIDASPGGHVWATVHVSGTRLATVTNAAFTAGHLAYYVLVSKDASFTTLVDFAFTQLPAYAPRSLVKPTSYPDETTTYYWAVLPAIAWNGGLASGNPLLAWPSAFQKQSTPPSLVAPGVGASVPLQPTFRWTRAEAARRYRLQISTDPSFGTLLDDVLTDSTAYTANNSYPADTLLYWRVRADDENLIGLTWSATGTFRRTLPAPVPSPSNPTAGDAIPAFTWEPVTGAVSYDFAGDEPDGEHKQWDGFPTTAVTPILMTGTGVFGWRVRATFPKVPSGVTPGPWSPTKTFTRTIAEPGGASTDAGAGRLLFSWGAKAGVKNYRVQVSQRPEFLTVVEDVTTDNTNHAPLLTQPAYTAGGTFYWRVAAMDADRNVGDWSQPQKFTLPAPPKAITTPARLRLVARVSRIKKRPRLRRVVIRVTAAGRPVQGVIVRALGRGARPSAIRTGTRGTAPFRVRRGKRYLFMATKAGFFVGTLRLRVR